MDKQPKPTEFPCIYQSTCEKTTLAAVTIAVAPILQFRNNLGLQTGTIPTQVGGYFATYQHSAKAGTVPLPNPILNSRAARFPTRRIEPAFPLVSNVV
jgi:hypothetical protein